MKYIAKLYFKDEYHPYYEILIFGVKYKPKGKLFYTKNSNIMVFHSAEENYYKEFSDFHNFILNATNQEVIEMVKKVIEDDIREDKEIKENLHKKKSRTQTKYEMIKDINSKLGKLEIEIPEEVINEKRNIFYR